MIDAAKIEELRGLDAAATPGPWKWDGDVCDGSQDYRDQNAPWLVTDDLLEVPILRGDITGSRDADAALIVAMRNALPELLDLASSLASAGEDGELCKALTSYQQADEEGVMVLVSRQACDEAATRIRALASEKEGLRRETGRQCVNCGRWFPKEWDRAKAPDDCKSPDACTIDMTADEAWQHWRKEAHTERARAESSESLVTELREKVKVLMDALEQAGDFIQRESDFRDESCEQEDIYTTEPRNLCLVISAALRRP